MVATPQALTVAAYLGRANDQRTIDLADQHLPIVTAFVRAYTRGGGFPSGTPTTDVAAVITTATARLTTNPEQVTRYQTADYAETPAVLDGFTLPELAVLHRYRKRAL